MPTFKLTGQDGKPYNIEATSEANAHEALREYESKQKPAAGKTRQQEIEEGSRMALEGQPWHERARINLGAGINSAIEGAKGLFQDDSPERDREIDERRLRDRAAADSMTGGTALQIAGEIAPSLVIPGGGVANLTRAGLAKAGATQFAKPWATRPGTWAATTDAAAIGGLGGAIQERKSSESATADVLFGVVGGTMLPRLLSGGKRVVDWLRSGVVAEREAAERLVTALGGADEAQKAVDQVAGYKPHAFAKDIPLSTAEVTQNTKLAQLEKGSRTAEGEAWVPFRESQAQARWKALQEATGEAPNLAAHMDARDLATQKIRERALGRAEKDPFFTAPVAQKLDDLMRGDLRANKNVQSIMGYVGGELDKGVTPGQLYEVRKTLTDKLNGKVQLTDELGNAIKGSRAATMQIVKAIDAGLDDASKGQWDKYLKTYQSKSGEVDNARASEKLREWFESPKSGTPFGRAGEEVPAVTSDKLRKQMEAFGPDDYGGNNFNFGTQDALQGLQQNLDRTFNLQNTMHKVATGGGGSNTASDRVAAGALSKVVSEFGPSWMRLAAPNMIRPLLESGKKAEAVALREALQNPEQFVKIVSEKLRRGQPLSASEEVVALAIRSASVGAPAMLQGQ